MPRIALLPPGLVNQIAAGEVVERPASVVKELVENAIDAGATSLQIDSEEGGTSLVRVSDDGCGMDSADAVMALERHATSKLRDLDGLSAIGTMGFRGEAIPAIASVSRFRLDTCARDGEPGMRLVVEGGRVVEQGAVARSRGTTVEVRDLFFNTPARRKFLKAPAAEAAQVSEAVIRLALARPDLAFTYRSASNRVALALPPRSSLRDRAAVALGRGAAGTLVQLDATRGEVRVHGAVTGPDHSEATSRSFYLFVNGRFVRDRGAAHSLLRAYAGLLPGGRHPAAVLYVELPADRVDVNVHPQKLEVRFADARAVYDAIHRAAADALRTAPWLRHRPAPPGALGMAGELPPVAVASEDGAAAAAEVLTWRRAEAPAGESLTAPAPLSNPAHGRSGAFAFAATPAPSHDPDAPAPGYFGSLRYIGQHSRTYLLCEAPGGSLVVIDQHASHERLLFHRLGEAWRSRSIAVQPLLVPQVVTLPPGPARVIESSTAELLALGLDVEPFGGDAIAVKGAPAALAGVDLARLLLDLAQQVEHSERGTAVDAAVHLLLATMACHAAVRANQDLSPSEARALLDGLDAIDFKGRCPHGRPVVFELGREDLERRVGRR